MNPLIVLVGLGLAGCGGGGSSASPPVDPEPLTDVEGWTELAPSVDSRVVYVSSSDGNDRASGLSERAPKRTIAAGIALLRHGFPDWLLLKRGDEWVDEALGSWKTGGRSREEPLVIADYGDRREPRPLLLPGEQPEGFRRKGGSGTPPSIDHVRLVGIDFYAYRRDPDHPSYDPEVGPGPGFGWIGSGTDILIEDCRFRFFSTGMTFRSDTDARVVSDVRIRRCLVTDSYNIDESGHSQGLFFKGVDGILVEECVVDRNGWHGPAVHGSHRTKFNHNIYVQTDNVGEIVFRDNLVLRGSSHGLQLRSGGTITGNVFARNAIGFFYGQHSPSTVVDNVVLEADDIGDQRRGWGIELKPSPHAVVENNIVAHKLSNARSSGFQLGSQPNPELVPANRLEFRGNIVHDWGPYHNARGPIYISEEVPFELFVTEGNVAEDEFLEDGDPVEFVDPDRDLATYQASLRSRATFEAFVAQVRRQRRGFYREEYSAMAVGDYIRSGFRIVPPGPSR